MCILSGRPVMARISSTMAAAVAGLLISSCAQIEQQLPQIGSNLSKTSCPTTAIGTDTDGASTWPSGCENIDVLDLGVAQIGYYLLQEGAEDAASPSLQSTVVAHYEGRRASDGVIIDSSYARGKPATFALSDVILGWGALLQTMRTGDEVVAYIPSSLGYGDTPRGDLIPANTDLIFRISLLDVIGAQREVAQTTTTAPAAPTAPQRAEVPANVRPLPTSLPSGPTAAAWAANLPWLPTGPNTIRTGTGVSYVVIKSGDPSGPQPSLNSTVRVHYDGRLAETGERFDSSWVRGEPAQFPVDGVIAGWTEVLQLMRPGDRWLVNIPPILAYGDKGSSSGTIGPNETLMFEINLLDVLN